MKKINILLVILISFLNCQAQETQEYEKIQKNTFRFFYAPAITKTMFEASLEEAFEQNQGGGFVQELYNSHIPNRPLLGSLIGFDFSRTISPQWSIGVGYRYTLKGQQSPHFYNYNGSFPSNPFYGGTSYEIILTSNELLLKFDRKLFSVKNLLFSSIGFGLTMDVHKERIVRNYIIERKTGIKRKGCCSSNNTVFTTGSNIDRFLWHIRDKHFRFGLFISNSYDLKISKNIFLSLTPELEYLSKILDKETFEDTGIYNNIWLFSLQSGLKIKF